MWIKINSCVPHEINSRLYASLSCLVIWEVTQFQKIVYIWMWYASCSSSSWKWEDLAEPFARPGTHTRLQLHSLVLCYSFSSQDTFTRWRKGALQPEHSPWGIVELYCFGLVSFHLHLEEGFNFPCCFFGISWLFRIAMKASYWYMHFGIFPHIYLPLQWKKKKFNLAHIGDL